METRRWRGWGATSVIMAHGSERTYRATMAGKCWEGLEIMCVCEEQVGGLKRGVLKCIPNLLWGESWLCNESCHHSAHSEGGMEFVLVRPLLPQKDVQSTDSLPCQNVCSGIWVCS